MEFLQQLEQSTFLVWIRESGSLWGYPSILFLHTLGLATVAGVNAGISLRLLGFAPQVPVGPLLRLFPVIWAAFVITALSGTVLLMADATAKLSSPVFYVKMLFIVLALVTMQMVKKRVITDPQVDTRPLAPIARTLAAASLFFWAAATLAGRLMAYIGPVSGLE
jgi:hypothetical protein